jgi:transposase
MQRRLRRNHTPALKAKVALAAGEGDRTLAQLAEQFDVHPNQITSWKAQLESGATDVFDPGGGGAAAHQRARQQRHHNQHGWKRRLARQRLRRTAVAQRQIPHLRYQRRMTPAVRAIFFAKIVKYGVILIAPPVPRLTRSLGANRAGKHCRAAGCAAYRIRCWRFRVGCRDAPGARPHKTRLSPQAIGSCTVGGRSRGKN